MQPPTNGELIFRLIHCIQTTENILLTSFVLFKLAVLCVLSVLYKYYLAISLQRAINAFSFLVNHLQYSNASIKKSTIRIATESRGAPRALTIQWLALCQLRYVLWWIMTLLTALVFHSLPYVVYTWITSLMSLYLKYSDSYPTNLYYQQCTTCLIFCFGGDSTLMYMTLIGKHNC